MPGKPQQNGRHERMHRTLKARVCKSPGYDMRQQQGMFDDFLQDYNFERPHQALELRTPSELYVPSPRAMPLRIAPADYPAHMDVRKVKTRGQIKLNAKEIHLGQALMGEHVGLKFEDDDRTVSVYFCEIEIGRIDLHEKVCKFRHAKPAMSVGDLAPDSATLHPTPAPPTDIASPS